MRLEIKIIGLMAKDPERKFTINEISRILNEYYSLVHRTISNLSKSGIIIKNKVGKAYVCALNMQNEKTFALIQLSEIERKEQFCKANKETSLILEDFVRSALSQLGILTIVLFGSYAKGSSTRESDIDILLITKHRGNVEKVVKEIYAKYGKEIAPVVLAPSDFKKQKSKPLIKEIMNDHCVLYGAENFVNLVFK